MFHRILKLKLLISITKYNKTEEMLSIMCILIINAKYTKVKSKKQINYKKEYKLNP